MRHSSDTQETGLPWQDRLRVTAHRLGDGQQRDEVKKQKVGKSFERYSPKREQWSCLGSNMDCGRFLLSLQYFSSDAVCICFSMSITILITVSQNIILCLV